jgi:hypothetical protein
MTSESDHEAIEERNYPLTRLTSTIASFAKNTESHSSDVKVPPEECADVMVPQGKSTDNPRSSLAGILKAIVEAFGRSADSSQYYFRTRYSDATQDEPEE